MPLASGGFAIAQSVATPTKTAPASEVAREQVAAKAKNVSEPKLLALTWQEGDEARGKFSDIPFWKTDGTLLSPEEVAALQQEISSTQIHWLTQPQSRPLVMIFDVGDELPAGTGGVTVTAKTAGGRSLRGGTRINRRAGKQTPSRMFAVTALTAFLRSAEEEFQWPKTLDLNLEFPSESLTRVKVLKTPPDVPVKLARGVTWRVEPDAGYDPRDRDKGRFAAGVLEISDSALDLAEYSVEIYRRAEKDPLDEAFSTIRERDDVRYTIRVSQKFPDVDELDRIEFHRQLFRRITIPNVTIRSDLLP